MPTLTTADGATYEIVRGTVTLPRVGVWQADLVVDVQKVPAGNVVLSLSGVDMPARIRRGETVGKMSRVRVVGGNGGLSRTARPRFYKNSLASHVLENLMADAGERLSNATTASVLNLPLSYWATFGLPVGEILNTLSSLNGWSWRVWFDGTVWLGAETWPECPSDVRIIEPDPENASAIVGTDTSGIWPGTTILGRKVDTVVHELGGETPRSRVWFADEKKFSGQSDRMRFAGGSVGILDPHVKYRCLYRAKVVSQSGHSVDVVPHDKTVPPMSGIPIRHGVPGVVVSVSPGCTVQVAFDDGRPDRPFAALWSADATAVKVAITGDSVCVGGVSPSEAAVKGNTLATMLAAAFSAIGADMASLGKLSSASACSSFVTNVARALSSNVKIGG